MENGTPKRQGRGIFFTVVISILFAHIPAQAQTPTEETPPPVIQDAEQERQKAIRKLWQDLEKSENEQYKDADEQPEFQDAMEILQQSLEESMSLLGSEGDRTPILVMSGGFNSCSDGNPLRQGMATQLFTVIQKFQKTCQCQIQWVLACQDLDSDPYVLTSISPKSQPQHMRESDLIAVIRKMSDPDPSQKSLYIVGHSHGGWRAMGIARSLQNLKNIRLLLTLDPISKRDCGIAEGAGSFLGFGGAACRRAPTEFQDMDKSVRWTNIYQTAGFLHSGPVQTKHATNVSFGAYGHTRIDNASQAWDYFSRQLR